MGKFVPIWSDIPRRVRRVTRVVVVSGEVTLGQLVLHFMTFSGVVDFAMLMLRELPR